MSENSISSSLVFSSSDTSENTMIIISRLDSCSFDPKFTAKSIQFNKILTTLWYLRRYIYTHRYVAGEPDISRIYILSAKETFSPFSQAETSRFRSAILLSKPRLDSSEASDANLVVSWDALRNFSNWKEKIDTHSKFLTIKMVVPLCRNDTDPT